MSTPVDIPQNINIHVSQQDKVVEPPKTNVAENSTDRSFLEMSNKEPEHKHLITKKDKDKEKEQEKEKEKKRDHFEKQQFKRDNSSKNVNPNKETESDIPENHATLKNDSNIGRKIDFSV